MNFKEVLNHVNDNKTEDVTEDVCDNVSVDDSDNVIDDPTQCPPDQCTMGIWPASF